jgi:translation initiation factor 6
LTEAKVRKFSIRKNPFIGLFLEASDELALVPKSVPEKNLDFVEDTLGVKALRLFVGQSDLLGLMACLNSNGCVLSQGAEEEEKKALKQAGLNVMVLERFSPGNNIVANDKATVVSSSIPREDAKKIGECLGVEVHQTPLSHYSTPGSLNVATNKGLLAFAEIPETEFKLLERILGVKGGVGTVNNGAPFNALGLVANSKGALLGEACTGFEVQRVYEALFG